MERLDRRDLRFVAACLLVIAAGSAVTAALFRRAFPEASIEFRVNRNQARVLAERLLAERGRDIAHARFAGQFAVDDTAKVYLERELGLEKAGRLYGHDAKIWHWQMRWFRSGVPEEERVTLSPLGELVGFRSVVKEDAPGDRPTQEAARAIAVRFLASRGFLEKDLQPIEATPVSRPNRTDWTFVDERAGVRFADARIRYSTTVSAGRVMGFREFVYVPQAWMRDYERLRSKNEAAGQVATFGLFVTVLAMISVLITKIVRKDVPWRLVGLFGGTAFVLALLSMLNEIPLTIFGYDTASSLSSYLTRNIVLGILGAVATAAGIAIVIAAAEPIYRERFPRQISLSGALSPRGIQTKGFFLSVLLGYALAAFFFAYQAVFYVVAERFGAWAPADVPYSDMLNTAFPWATVLLIGFLPAVSEEGISRMFSISFLDRLGAGRILAVVLPAYIWGFGHSTYPNQPFFIRGLEVGTAGVLIGFLMLRFGVVPLLIWHFTVDAIYTALLLLRSHNAYYVISGAIASGILLLPLVASLVLYLRRGGFATATGLANGDLGFVPPPAPAERISAPVPPVERVRGRTLAWMGAAALCLLASFGISDRYAEPLVEDHIGRDAALARAERFLRANGVSPDAWHHVVYQGTGFADDEEVRSEKPQDEGRIPAFSDAAARYVVEKGGPAAFRRLSERELPLAYWVVRFFQPEKKEEWKVLIDARRARVVAFVHPVAEDAPAKPPPPAETARRRAVEAAEKLGYPSARYAVLEVGTETRPKRVDTTVVLQAAEPGIGDAHPRLTAVFHGPSLAAFVSSIRVPEDFLRARRKRSVVEWLLIAVKVVAAGALVGGAVILFLRLVRHPDFRWKAILRPVFWVGLVAAAGLANAGTTLFRQYRTEIPIALFRLGVAVSLAIGLLGILLVAALGFTLFAGARPGWEYALRRLGSLRDAALRASIAAGGALGLTHALHGIASRVPALYDPDPSLPASLPFAIPGLEVLWTAARGTFAVAAMAAAAALALRSELFRTSRGRLIGAATVVLAMLPIDLDSAAGFAADVVPAILMAAWIGACALLLLRDHAAAWVLFGLIAFGGRGVTELLAQPAPADRAAGWVAVGLLVAGGIALLAGRTSTEEAPTAA